MSLQSTKIWRDLWVNKARTVLIVLAIAVGVAAFGLMIAGRTVLEANLRDQFAASQPAHAVLTVSDFDSDLVEDVRAVDGVTDAEGRRSVWLHVETEPDHWSPMEIHAVPDAASLAVNRLFFEPGADSSLAAGEVLLERDIAAMMTVRQGDAIRIKTLNGETHTLTVAGFVNDLSRLPSSISLTAYGFVSMDTLDAWDEPDQFNRLYVITEGTDRASIERITTRVVEAVEGDHSVFSASVPQPGKSVMGDNMVSVLGLLGAMGTLTLILSAFLVINVMSAVVVQQIQQIGILKSMGTKTASLVWLYMRLVLVFGLLALILSIPMSAIGAYFLADGMADGMNFNVTRFWLPLDTLGLQAAAAILVPLLAAAVPIFTGAAITIREAISGRRDTTSARSTPVDWLLGRIQALPNLTRVSVRNTFRNTARLVLTFAALSLAGAMFIAIIGVRQALFRAVNEMQREASYDVGIDLARPYPLDQLDAALEDAPDVVDYEGWGTASARIVFNDRLGGSITLIGVPANTNMVRPSITQGRWLRPDEPNTLFVNADTLDLAPNLGEGAELRLDVGGSEETWTIVGVGTRGFDPVAYISYQDFERITGLEQTASRVVIRTRSSRPADQQRAELVLLERLDSEEIQVAASLTTTEANERSAAQMDILIVLLMAMMVLISVVGGLGLAITMSLNVMERTREIGILRSIGAKTGVIRRVVVGEGIVIAVISWAIGALMSIPLGSYLGDMLGEALLARPLDYALSLPSVAAWLGLVIVIAIGATLVPAESAARLTIRDTLAYE